MRIYVTAAGLRYILRPKFVEIIIKKNRNSSLRTKPEFLKHKAFNRMLVATFFFLQSVEVSFD